MAEKRMFAKKITNDDYFTSMPPTTQALYFHLCMGADDDGFSNNIRIAMFNAHATTDDFQTLVSKKFIIPFDSGVIVITHWKLHNYIQNDRYHETSYLEEKAQVVLEKNNVYTLDTKCIQDGYNMYPQIRLDKSSIDKFSLDKTRVDGCSTPTHAPKKAENKHKYGEYGHVRLTDSEHEKLVKDYGEDKLQQAIVYLDEYMEMTGKTYKSCNLALRRWVFTAVAEQKNRQKNNKQTQLDEWANA